MLKPFWVLVTLAFVLPGPSRAQTRNLEVDFSKVIGTIKPLNGVNGGPIVSSGIFDFSAQFSALRFPHIRLHDVPWMSENAVDINYIFSRAEADVDDPRSYDFFSTDYYIKSIRSLGAEMTYRLGYSAESVYHPRIHNAPPTDFAKWAAICAHIVRHYNQGWDHGYQFNIKYWEVWNEPDAEPWWTGTPQEYQRLYELTARSIKNIDPTLKVGGPTLTGSGPLEFVESFVKYCRDHNVPLDFVSWHSYAQRPYDVVLRAAKVQELLDKYGFSKVESVMDEWNYFPGNLHVPEMDPRQRQDFFARQIGGVPGAAYTASVLIYLQDSTVDLADYYQGTNMFWGGLFDSYGFPRKPYFTFRAFKFLLDTPQRVMTSGSDCHGLAIIAGLSNAKSEAAILISNFGTQVNHYNLSLRALPWKSPINYEKYTIDGHHDLDLVKSEKLMPGTVTVSEDVETPSVCLIRLSAAP